MCRKTPFFLILTVAVSAWLAIPLRSQTMVSGTVRDINTHREISHVNVFFQGTEKGTVTDAHGRFALPVPPNLPDPIVVFRHIGYEEKRLTLQALRTQPTVYLQPRVISYPELTVVGESESRPDIEKDLPQVYSLLDSRQFEIRGFTDAGDVLRMDHSVQVDEELSGKKTVGIRGGNPDEVVVLFNGIKLNNTFNNVFDFSLIDTEDIERFEIIKGSNTALYGPEAFAGVVNIVPRLNLDYHLRFQQRIGTYRSGNWGLHVNPGDWLWNTDRLQASYSFKRGGMKRFVAGDGGNLLLGNTSSHHLALFSYALDSVGANPAPARVTGLGLVTDLTYDNELFRQSLVNRNRLGSLRYEGPIAGPAQFDITAAYKDLSETETRPISQGFLDRRVADRSLFVNLEARLQSERGRLLFGYQLEKADLDYRDRRQAVNLVPVGIEEAGLRRLHHGLVLIGHLTQRPESPFLRRVDISVSLRHDLVRDRRDDVRYRDAELDTLTDLQPSLEGRKTWRESTAKFGMEFVGLRRDLTLNAFIKFGLNAKFPTLHQQISTQVPGEAGGRYSPTLEPERNRSMEMGLLLRRQIDEHPSLFGWGLSAVYFQNHYDNKFRMFGLPGLPIALYDNVADARISGFEITQTLYLYRKKVTLDLGISRYFISDRAAFPFKSDLKRTLRLTIDHAGYSLQALWFFEGDQVGWVPTSEGGLAQVEWPSFSNLDVHLSKRFEISMLTFYLNVSGRNLLNGDEVRLQGLALRDRRVYLTFGAQF